MDLAQQFQPIVYLHPSEIYYPIAIHDYIDKSHIFDRKLNKVIAQQLSSSLLGQLITNDNHGMSLNDESAKYGNSDVNEVPVYVRINRNRDDIYITYVYFYGYNAPLKLFGLIPFGAHFADLEHVTLKIHNNTIDSIYISYHANGQWLSKNDIQFDGLHPILYSARGSHATYNRPGALFRLFGFGNDRTAKGRKWKGSLFQLRDKQDPGYNNDIDGFVYYAGNFGRKHVGGFVDRIWWHEPWKEEVKPGYVWLPINIRMDFVILFIFTFITIKKLR